MAKVFGAAVAGADVLGATVGADILGTAVGAEAAIAPDVAAFGAASSADLAAASVPEVAAGADLTAADTLFGTFSPDLFAANAADVAAGGTAAETAAFGAGATDLTGAAAGITGEAAGAVPSGTAIDSGFFTGTGSDLFSGVGGGGGLGDVGTSTFQPFGETFSADATQAGAQGGGIGSFGGGAQMAGPPGTPLDFGPGGATETGPAGAGPTATEATTPMVQGDTGIVDTGGSNFADRFNASFGDTPPTGQQTISQDFSSLSQMTPSNPTFMNSPTGTDLSSIMDTPANTGQLATMQQVGIPNVPTADMTGTLGNLPPSDFAAQQAYANPIQQFATPGGAPTSVASNAAPALPPAQTVEAAPGAIPSSPAAVANAPATTAATSAAGGPGPLNALRYGAAGINLATAGINLSNALNQPSYSALQPIAYPGSRYAAASAPPYAGPYSGQTPLGAGGTAGTGGIAGGLAANRLTNSLVSGASPQQLAASGLISPQRATELQSTYTGIAQQYARELGVSPQSLSPGIKQMIAAQALADQGLGGR